MLNLIRTGFPSKQYAAEPFDNGNLIKTIRMVKNGGPS